MLLAHMVISFFGLIFATVMYFRPSRNKVTISYALLVGTFSSGSFLLLSNGTHILEACVMGLIYFAIIALAIHATEKKLAEVSE